MNKKSILSAIASVCLLMVAMIPLALCFGFMAKDVSRFVHNIFTVGLYSLIIGLVTYIWSLMD